MFNAMFYQSKIVLDSSELKKNEFISPQSKNIISTTMSTKLSTYLDDDLIDKIIVESTTTSDKIKEIRLTTSINNSKIPYDKKQNSNSKSIKQQKWLSHG